MVISSSNQLASRTRTPLKADKTMYLSATASTLCTEAILQLFGAYNFGYTTDYGRKINIYTNPASGDLPYGTALSNLYAGAILWMVCIFLAVGAIGWSVFGIHERISKFSYLGPRKKAKKGASRCAKRQVWIAEGLEQKHLVNDTPEAVLG
ncbi:hypothetical protein G7Y89_g9814 [Cudoniella acicularis]|uniref:Uncharacterized protein n=1 Tax=Cudoniella acicularis TaxID=354080 RepID=A0A8H4RGM8_9HELO|nr:hypothetical protein G7Y89_g9814 [Cudoniella acicularis]